MFQWAGCANHNDGPDPALRSVSALSDVVNCCPGIKTGEKINCAAQSGLALLSIGAPPTIRLRFYGNAVLFPVFAEASSRQRRPELRHCTLLLRRSSLSHADFPPVRRAVHLYGSRQVDTAKLIDCSHTAALQPNALPGPGWGTESGPGPAASYRQKPGYENVQRGRAAEGGRKVLGGRGGIRSYTNPGRGRGGSHCLGADTGVG